MYLAIGPREYKFATGVLLASWGTSILLTAVVLWLEPLAWRVARGWV